MVRLYTARWLLPASAPPVRDGAVAVDAAGRIAYAGPAADAPAGETTPLGDAALLPGLVAFLPAGAEAVPAPAATTVATADPRHADALLGARRAVVYQPAATLASLQRAVPALRARFAPASDRLRLGVAPAPLHETSEDAFLDLCAWAVGENLPLAVQAGATAAEVAFLRDAAGPHADALRARGTTVVRRAHSAVHLLAELGVAAVARPLLVGGSLFDESDVALAAYYGCPVAYAPPNAPPDPALGALGALADPLADPLAAVRDAGVPVALVARDPFAAALALGTPPDAAFHLATLGAAQALGLDAETGSLTPGKHADLCAFPLTPAELDVAETLGPAAALATAAQRPPTLALVSGTPLRPA